MSKTDTGGQVYPFLEFRADRPSQVVMGITRRDQCADRIAAEMAGDWFEGTHPTKVDEACEAMSELAYKLSDALIAEGRKGE